MRGSREQRASPGYPRAEVLHVRQYAARLTAFKTEARAMLAGYETSGRTRVITCRGGRPV